MCLQQNSFAKEDDLELDDLEWYRYEKFISKDSYKGL
jgi:hypothetical protein